MPEPSDKLKDQLEASQARVAMLEEALRRCRPYLSEDCRCSSTGFSYEDCEKVLSQSPSDWLAQHDAAIRCEERERCAKVADIQCGCQCRSLELSEICDKTRRAIASAIRSLPDEVKP